MRFDRLLRSVTGAMPFNLNEVVELASILRDVCLGLVELAYPDARPSTSFNFVKARTGNTEEDTRYWMHLFKVRFTPFLQDSYEMINEFNCSRQSISSDSCIPEIRAGLSAPAGFGQPAELLYLWKGMDNFPCVGRVDCTAHFELYDR